MCTSLGKKYFAHKSEFAEQFPDGDPFVGVTLCHDEFRAKTWQWTRLRMQCSVSVSRADVFCNRSRAVGSVVCTCSDVYLVLVWSPHWVRPPGCPTFLAVMGVLEATPTWRTRPGRRLQRRPAEVAGVATAAAAAAVRRRWSASALAVCRLWGHPLRGTRPAPVLADWALCSVIGWRGRGPYRPLRGDSMTSTPSRGRCRWGGDRQWACVCARCGREARGRPAALLASLCLAEARFDAAPREPQRGPGGRSRGGQLCPVPQVCASEVRRGGGLGGADPRAHLLEEGRAAARGRRGAGQGFRAWLEQLPSAWTARVGRCVCVAGARRPPS